ncbi:uncharacterized protein LOC117118563 [Anneissia japonica]|uniref:uncharacterized protein LOC117118563 n=1 Tax=Anneissia japonica TaxID=1529436 RepID=UPI001425B854|nr:uncharacterized protein LOC117118563 [Anneissia japonica]
MTNRLFDAVASIRYRQIEILLQCGVDINSKNHEGKTVLMIACDIQDDKKRYKMFRYLVHKGSDEFETDQEGVSVFQHACRAGRTKILKRMMKEKGLRFVHLSWKDNHNRCALFHAVLCGKIDIVRRILIAMKNQGISIDQVDADGNTSLILAYKRKFPKIAELLLNEGNANPRICDRERHLSAAEWAEVCDNELDEEKKIKSEKHREKNMIFPRIDHVVFRRKQAKKRQNYMYRLPLMDDNITENSLDSYRGNAHIQRYPLSKSWAGIQSQTQTSESAVYSHVTRGNQMQSDHGKSIDSAMELLELASRAGGKRHYATSFVGSELDTTKSSMDDGNMISSMMATYSIQNSQSFRKTVKPQPKPIPRAPTRDKKRVSTLAIIMNRGSRSSLTGSRGRRGSRPTSRVSGKASKRQSRPATRQKKNGQHSSNNQRRSSTVQVQNADFHKPSASGDVNFRRSLELIPEENASNKTQSKKSLRHSQFPDIGIRLVTQGVR